MQGRGGIGRLLGGVLHWAPVWVPLVLLWQVGTLGLKPALAEEARLVEEGKSVEERHERTRAQFESLENEAEAWQDPVYQERRRRMHDASRVETSGQ